MEAVEQALQGLREGFQADGADLELVSIEEGHVRVRLVGTDATCWDCIVPPHMLRQVVDACVRRAWPPLEDVEVEDPREL